MIEPQADRPRPTTLGADRGYKADFVNPHRDSQSPAAYCAGLQHVRPLDCRHVRP